MRKFVGHDIPDAKVHKVASLVRRLSGLQNNGQGTVYVPERNDGLADAQEFGADLPFLPPARFLVDNALDGSEFLVNEVFASPHDRESSQQFNHSNVHSQVNGRTFDLVWLRSACGEIVNGNVSQLSQDELAMAICRILDSEKPGEEVSE